MGSTSTSTIAFVGVLGRRGKARATLFLAAAAASTVLNSSPVHVYYICDVLYICMNNSSTRCKRISMPPIQTRRTAPNEYIPTNLHSTTTQTHETRKTHTHTHTHTHTITPHYLSPTLCMSIYTTIVDLQNCMGIR